MAAGHLDILEKEATRNVGELRRHALSLISHPISVVQLNGGIHELIPWHGLTPKQIRANTMVTEEEWQIVQHTRSYWMEMMEITVLAGCSAAASLSTSSTLIPGLKPRSRSSSGKSCSNPFHSKNKLVNFHFLGIIRKICIAHELSCSEAIV